MKRILIPIYICSLIGAQDEVTAETQTDTTFVETTIVDTTIVEESVDTAKVKKASDRDYSLEYGYKGYQWGSKILTLPILENMSAAQPSSDNRSITMSGKLGIDSVKIFLCTAIAVFGNQKLIFNWKMMI